MKSVARDRRLLQRLGAVEESHSPWPRYQGGTVDHSVTGILGWNVPPSGTVKFIGSSI